jgi:curved DNA-binding protein CbpA
VADKTLYDILEVSSGASPEAIKAAYARLSAKFAAGAVDNPQGKALADAVKEAFLTLGNPKLRAEYDAKIAGRSRSDPQHGGAVQSFWTLPKVIVLALVLVIGGTYYYLEKQTEMRLAAKKAIAEARATEAAEKAKAEAEQAKAATEQAQLDYQRQRDEQKAEDRSRKQMAADVRQLSEQERQQDLAAQREQQAEQSKQAQRQQDQAQATADARAQAQRDRAELCRLERQKYGHAVSC